MFYQCLFTSLRIENSNRLKCRLTCQLASGNFNKKDELRVTNLCIECSVNKLSDIKSIGYSKDLATEERTTKAVMHGKTEQHVFPCTVQNR